MKETSETYPPSTLSDTPNAISSPELVAGATLCDSQAGPIVDLCGPDRAPASLSARRAKEQGLMTSGTYGPHSSTSLNSDILQLSLESRLQARLDSRGSTLFKLTWKRRTTPQQRSIFALRASGLRTSVSVYSGVPTPCSQDGPKGGPGQGTDRLPGAAALAAVPTPMAGTPAQNGNNEAGNNDYSRKIVELASLTPVATPKSSDGSGGRTTKTVGGGNSHLGVQARLASVPTPNLPTGGPNSHSTATHTGGMDLEGAASLASLDLQVRLAAATPAARDYKSNSSTDEFQSKQWNHPRGKPLSAQATLADSGLDATGGMAVTKSSGQLNPDYSRWLQGYPNEWGSCADMVILSSRRSRRNS